jgi:hypothetical protein
MGGFTQSAQSLSTAMNAFGGHATALSEAISSIPRSLNGSFSHTVQVVHNGIEILGKLTPEIQNMVVTQVKSELSRVFKEQMPDAGVNLD